jgi:alpha-beta hydrolase superfamily lysophospholipase
VATTLITRDNLSLHLRHWPCTPSVGTVLIVHGLGEHCGRYQALATHLNRWGWHVISYDHRGHGESPGGRGQLNESDDLLHDLAAVIDHARAARPGRLVLLGHSMGGLVAARFVAGGLGELPSWYREVDALVLSSPALDAGLGPLQSMFAGTLAVLAPDLSVGNGLKPAWVSRDAAVVAAYVADPLVHDRISAKLLQFITHSGEFVRAQAWRWRTPTLLMFAGSDRCVAPRGSVEFAKRAPQHVVSSREFAALFHEIFNEPEREQVFGTLQAWLAGFVANPKANPHAPASAARA